MAKDYSVKDVAELIGVHPMTITRRIRDGKLKAFRTNGDSGSYRITEEALNAYRQYREQYPFGHALPVEVASNGN